MARIFQDSREKQAMGAKKAPWWVEWRENGRRRSQKAGTRSAAKVIKATKETEARDRRNGATIRKSWKDFREQYEREIISENSDKAEPTRRKHKQVLNTYENTMHPLYVTDITNADLTAFKSKREKAPGKKKGDKLSKHSLHSELGTLMDILSQAVTWHYLAAPLKRPKVRRHAEDSVYMTLEHFDAVWAACDAARMPQKTIHPGQHYTAAEWWRGLLGLLAVTGMRISDALAIRWEDVDLDAGRILSRARNNKGKRTQFHYIRPAVDELRPLVAFDPRVFPWNHHRRTLDVEYHRIQRAAGIHLPCPREAEHECTDACHLYGFHSIRYAFATNNYGNGLSDKELQEQMGHASFETTKRYIAYAERREVRDLNVVIPKSMKSGATA